MRVTDVKTGYGGCNAIIVSASEDRTCKVRLTKSFLILDANIAHIHTCILFYVHHFSIFELVQRPYVPADLFVANYLSWKLNSGVIWHPLYCLVVALF